MRIRFTLDIQRTPKPDPATEDESPSIYDVSSAQVEHAGRQGMGFTIPHTPLEDWGDDE